jgi:uncharacterized protein YkwD
MNWVDVLIILVFVAYVWDGYRRGFFKLTWELFGIIVAFIFALKFYPPLSEYIIKLFHLSTLVARSIAFTVIWIFTQLVFFLIGHLIVYYAPYLERESRINHILGLIPAMLKSLIFVAVILTLIIILPINKNLKNAIDGSLIGKYLINGTAQVENKFQVAFDSSENQPGLTKEQPEENSDLGFTTTDITNSEIDEDIIFNKTNEERESIGLPPLKKDILLRDVARTQSRDMAIRGYFSHTSLNNQTLLDRLTNAHVQFETAAENIAFAPTIDLAHIGLMNSTKHRDNILDPNFTRLGVGVVQAGSYGLLVTEDFAK